MKKLKYYLAQAKRKEFALSQFNFSDFVQIKAIINVAERMRLPVILGTSERESEFFGLEEAVALRDIFRKKTGLSIFLNLDHGKSFEYLKQAIDSGYDMVHFDGSELPLEENIKITKEVVRYAHRRGILVEGEVGKIEFEIKEENLTKPEEAKKFIDKTSVDLLAVSIGNLHGIKKLGFNPHLRLDKLADIKKSVKNALLVLHGGSGIPEDDIKEAIKLGIIKVNVNTELRLAFSENLRKILNEKPEEIVPYKFLPDVQKAVEKIVEEKIGLFGSVGKI